MADDEQAMAWLEAEHPVLLAAITQAVGARLRHHAWQLPWTLTTFLDRRGYWHDYPTTQDRRWPPRSAWATGRRRPAPPCLGHACTRLGSYPDAVHH